MCGARIAARGLGHLSLLPQATDADSVVYKAAQEAEVLSDEEGRLLPALSWRSRSY